VVTARLRMVTLGIAGLSFMPVAIVILKRKFLDGW
jgi:hypothetical protein